MIAILLPIVIGVVIVGLTWWFSQTTVAHKNVCMFEFVSRALKSTYASLAFFWILRKKKRLLDIHNVNSKDVEKLGLVASAQEKLWDSPQRLSVNKSLDKLSFYGLDDDGTFLTVSISRNFLNRMTVVSLNFLLPDGTTYQILENLVYNIDGDNYNAGGVKLQLLEPMRRWRIVFNGFVKRVKNGKENNTVLRINLLWTSFSRPFEFKREYENGLIAQNLARETWGSMRPPLPYNNHNYDGVDQWGAFFGTFTDSDLRKENVINLRGLRQKRWGQDCRLKRSIEVIGCDKEGNYFYLTAKNETIQHELWGHFSQASGFLRPVKDCNLDLEQLPSEFPKHAVFRFEAAGRNYQAIMSRLPIELTESYPSTESIIFPGELTFNSFPGRVMVIIQNQTETKPTPMKSLTYLSSPKRELTDAEIEKLVVSFDEEACQFQKLVGGKASSLALLSTLRMKDDLPVSFIVPNGFCLTVKAWEAQMKNNSEIQCALQGVEKVAKSPLKEELQEACHKAAALLDSTQVDSKIQDCIRKYFEVLYGAEFECKQFAVRSSAVGEDGDVLSSAGQNETVLGCRGFESVLKGLQKCWASLLMFQSVEYRRQNGEPLIPGMGVVIQEMVDAEAAGVLFTVNPNDGDPSKMILTANFGLGESVVSASADPDTIIIKRTYSGELSITERILGAKNSKIVLTDRGTSEEVLAPQESAVQCLSDGDILRVSHLGLYLEKVFGGPRDLEFAVSKGNIFLLQARPVTSLDSWTDFELQHEFDTALISKREYVTKANTGEVLPGSGTPLSISFSQRSMDMSFQALTARASGGLSEFNPWYIGRFTPLFSNQAFLNIIDMFRRDIDKEPSNNDRSVDMAVFGRLVITEEMHKMGLRRYGEASLSGKFYRYKSVFIDLFLNERRIKKVEPIYSNYTFPVDHYTSAKVLYDEITKQMPMIIDIGEAHMAVSRASGTAQMIAFILLLDGSDNWSVELYGEIAKLLTSISNVESADVPFALKKLAKAIAEDEESEKFVNSSTDDAVNWLKTSKRDAGTLYRAFIKRHGHRGVKEFDLMTETWELNPKGVVDVLQSMVANSSSFQEPKPTDWQTSLPPIRASKLRALKFFVPRSRAAVVAREKTKSLLVRTIHVFRMAYRKLSELLVQEHKIPDLNLIFFLTHSEIGDLIEQGGAGIVSKAKRRRKLYPMMNNLMFPEVSQGIPVPVEEQNYTLDEGVSELVGTPVYNGRVKATARVALNLDEAKLIQPGDVLITRSTDIGWSPYFPLLSGVVTELGGLISHGAVVAREYGLPAIVGCANATQVFKSGDSVLLDGTKGTITRLSERKMDDVD